MKFVAVNFFFPHNETEVSLRQHLAVIDVVFMFDDVALSPTRHDVLG